MEDKKFLCVMSDDFGMHQAVNEGIVQAFSEGILTDSNLMPPCPAFDEAARLTKRYTLPVGLHATFTCDWDKYLWGTLTNAPSLVTATGHLKPGVEEAWNTADEEEALGELLAQYQAITAHEIQPTHVGEHMGFDNNGMFVRLMAGLGEKYKLPHKGDWKHYPSAISHYQFKSEFSTSTIGTDIQTRKTWLKETLSKLGSGYHLWVTHAAVDDPALDKLCSPGYHALNWARLNRVIDLSLLLDQEVSNWLEELEIERVALTECPVSPESPH